MLLITTPLIALVAGLFGPPEIAPTPAADLTTVNDAAHQQFVFAYRLLQKGETILAIEAFDEYLEKHPKDEKRGDGFYFRAMLAHQAKEHDRAAALLGEISATMIVPPYAVDLLRGQVFSDLHRYEAALQSLEKIPTEKLGPLTKASVLYLRGLSYRGAKNLPGAAEALKAAAEIESPLRARTTLDLARTQIQLGTLSAAVETLRRCIALGETTVAAEAARIGGDVSYKAKQYGPAIDFYRVVATAHQGSPHFSAAMEGLLWSHYQAKLYQQLLETFRVYKEAIPDEGRVTAWYLAASAHQELDEHSAALALLQSILFAAAGSPIQDKVLYKLAASQFEMGQVASMQRTLDRLQQTHPRSALNDNAVILLAAADARADEPARGIARLSSLLEKELDPIVQRQALWHRAVLHQQNQQLELAIEDYDRYLVAGAPVRLAIHARLQLIDLNYRLQRFDASQIHAAELLDQEDIDADSEQEALYRRALALNKLEKIEPALQAIDTLLQKYPRNPYRHEAHYYRGLILTVLEQPDDAITSLLIASDSNDLDKPLRANALRLASLRLREKADRTAAADAMLRLEQIVGTAGLRPSERLWLGQYLVDDLSQAKQGLARLQSLFVDTEDVAARTQFAALLVGGRALHNLNDYDSAASAFRQAIAQGAGSVLTARLELARTLATAGKSEQAIAEYAELINAEATFAAKSLYESARIYRDLAIQHRRANDTTALHDDQWQARRLLKRLVLLYPEQSPLAELSHIELAQIATARGEADAADRELAELAANHPNTPYATYASAMNALKRRKLGDAKFLFMKLREQEIDKRLLALVERQLQVLERG